MSNSGGPPPSSNGGYGGPENNVGSNSNHSSINGIISTESAIAALGQHDQLFHRQVLHIRQQQVGEEKYKQPTVFEFLLL